MLDPQVLRPMWVAVGTHLWQSTIVMAALLKLFLPLPLLVKLWEPLSKHIVPLLPSSLRGAFGVTAGPAAGSGSAALYITLSAAWFLGAGWLALGWLRERNVPGLKSGTPVNRARPMVKRRLLKALQGTGIPPKWCASCPVRRFQPSSGVFGGG